MSTNRLTGRSNPNAQRLMAALAPAASCNTGTDRDTRAAHKSLRTQLRPELSAEHGHAELQLHRRDEPGL
jgi:hypothetical protein